MGVERCPKCHQYRYGQCRCKPFDVYYPDYFGDKPETVYGIDFDEVVEKLAEKLNEADPVFETNLFEYPVEITDDNGIKKRFNCIASISIDYSAEEIE